MRQTPNGLGVGPGPRRISRPSRAAGVSGVSVVSGAVEFFRLGSVDLEQILALEKQCFSCPWNEKQFRLALDQKMFNIFGLREHGRLLAYLSLYHIGEEMEILNLAVTPARRRQGLGSRLLGLVLQIGRNMGIEHVLLEVRESNVAARSLYAGLGFRQVGVRRRYYPDNGEDALLLRLELGEALSTPSRVSPAGGVGT